MLLRLVRFWITRLGPVSRAWISEAPFSGTPLS